MTELREIVNIKGCNKFFIWTSATHRTVDVEGYCCLWSPPMKHTLGWASLDEWSARRRGLYLQNTQETQETNIRALSGIRTRNPSNRAAADHTATGIIVELLNFWKWTLHVSAVHLSSSGGTKHNIFTVNQLMLRISETVPVSVCMAAR